MCVSTQSIWAETNRTSFVSALTQHTPTICDHSWISLEIHQSVKQNQTISCFHFDCPLPLSYIAAGCILEAFVTPRSWPLVWRSGTRGYCRSGCSRPGQQTLTFYACRSRTGKQKHDDLLGLKTCSVYQMFVLCNKIDSKPTCKWSKQQWGSESPGWSELHQSHSWCVVLLLPQKWQRLVFTEQIQWLHL